MPEVRPPHRIPYEVKTRYATKQVLKWVGYKVHLTESCEEGSPKLITIVSSAMTTATDVMQLCAIQEGLE
jgi:transposase